MSDLWIILLLLSGCAPLLSLIVWSFVNWWSENNDRFKTRDSQKYPHGIYYDLKNQCFKPVKRGRK